MNKISLFEGTIDDVKLLGDKINQFNAEQLSFIGQLEVEKSYFIKDEDGNVLGGITGTFYLGECLYICVLFVEESARHKGFGSLLLKKIEDEARDMKIKLIHLDTFDFQAKDFYLKHGYQVFGVLDDSPEGHKRYYMKKKIV